MGNDDLRDLFAGLAMQGLLMNGDFSFAEIPRRSYELADDMVSYRNQKHNDSEEGIIAIKRRRTKFGGDTGSESKSKSD